MAFLAFHNSVRAEEWKPVEVLLNGLHGNLPAEDRVALRAVGAELGAMNVSVAFRAVLSNIGKDGLDVATRTGHFFVHAAERIPRRVMIEFRDGADRGPAGIRVAIFAGSVERAVRTSAGLPLSGCGEDKS
jgi:hypothetical protein